MSSDYSWSRIGANLCSSIVLGGVAALGGYTWWYHKKEDTWYEPIVNYNEYTPTGVAGATLGLVAASAYVFINGVYTPISNKCADVKKKAVEWVKDHNRRDATIAVAAVGVGLASAVNYCAPTCGLAGGLIIGAAGGLYLNSESGKEALQSSKSPSLPLPPPSLAMINKGPLEIASDHRLHVDYEFQMMDPRNVNLIYSSLGAAFVGYMLDDDYMTEPEVRDFFLDATGKQLREEQLTIILSQNHGLMKDKFKGQSGEDERIELMRFLLKTKFGIEGMVDGKREKLTKENRTEQHNEFRKELLKTKGNITHPDLTPLLSGPRMTALLKELYQAVKNDTAAEAAEEEENLDVNSYRPFSSSSSRPATLGSGVHFGNTSIMGSGNGRRGGGGY